MLSLKTIAALPIIALAFATPARAAHLVNTVNFNFNALGCAITGGNGNTAGNTVFLDQTCSGFRNQEWAFVREQIIAEQLLAPLASACLDLQSTSPAPGTPVVVNRCNPGTGFQIWVYGGTGVKKDKIVNVKSGLCLDTVDLGNGVVQVVVGDCASTGAGQSWFIE